MGRKTRPEGARPLGFMAAAAISFPSRSTVQAPDGGFRKGPEGLQRNEGVPLAEPVQGALPGADGKGDQGPRGDPRTVPEGHSALGVAVPLGRGPHIYGWTPTGPVPQDPCPAAPRARPGPAHPCSAPGRGLVTVWDPVFGLSLCCAKLRASHPLVYLGGWGHRTEHPGAPGHPPYPAALSLCLLQHPGLVTAALGSPLGTEGPVNPERG